MTKYRAVTSGGVVLERNSKRVFTHVGVVLRDNKIQEVNYANGYNVALTRARSTSNLFTKWADAEHTVEVYELEVE